MAHTDDSIKCVLSQLVPHWRNGDNSHQVLMRGTTVTLNVESAESTESPESAPMHCRRRADV